MQLKEFGCMNPLKLSKKSYNIYNYDSKTIKNIKEMNEFLSKKSQPNIFFIKPKSTIQGFRIIEKRKECIGCHSTHENGGGIGHNRI